MSKVEAKSKKPAPKHSTTQVKASQTKSAPSAPKPALKRPTKSPAKKAPAPIVSTGYWLFKSEPDVFSWEMCKSRGPKGEPWTGVRNYLARNNMRTMALGDLGFFYHSNIGLEIVGVCEVCALSHPDTTTDDERWDCVDVRAVCDLPKPVTLADVKANPTLDKMSLVTAMRLSVQQVTKDEWLEICRMSGLDPKKLAR